MLKTIVVLNILVETVTHFWNCDTLFFRIKDQ